MDNKINYSDNLTFKSRIVFLSPKGMSKVFAKYQNKNLDNICDYFITNSEMAWDNGYRTNVKYGYTKEVKTCTAGVCANKGKNASLFWHVENSYNNLEKFPILENFIDGTNAIIIGSKKFFRYSTDMFDKFVKQTKNKNIPTTIIKGTQDSEASMLFDAIEDTLYVCMKNIFNKEKYVRSMEDLKQTCDTVEIAPTDSVEFYDFLPQKIK